MISTTMSNTQWYYPVKKEDVELLPEFKPKKPRPKKLEGDQRESLKESSAAYQEEEI